jgi:hypothetical protein
MITKLGTLLNFLQEGKQLVLSGFSRLKEKRMDPLIDIKPNLWLKVSIKLKELILMIFCSHG